jgi:hypothetical protein
VLGDTEVRNAISGLLYDEWTLDNWGDLPIVRLERERFLPMLVNKPAGYPETDQDDKLPEALLS